jgi:predicted nuclease with TOPRIM domain
MNTLWSLIASYLPSIPSYNDLKNNYHSIEEEPDDRSYELPTTTYNTMTLPSPSQLGQRHDRTILRPTDADRTRVKQLEAFNSRLQEQVLTLQRQLEHMQADFSSTKMELEHQRSANTLLVSQKGQLSVELAQACAARQAQADEVHKLRTSYAELATSVRTLESNGEELRSLETFLTKTDEYSGQQIIQAVHDLNTEILQLAAVVSDEFPLTRRSPGLWKESHCEFIREAIGDGMLALLRDGDHEDDPTIVQLAVQAWEVWYCRQVLDSFCSGAPPEVDRFLNDVFREMQSSGKPLLSVMCCAAHN